MKKGHIAGVGFLVLCIGAAIYVLLKPNPLRQAAASLMESFYVGNVDGIAHYMTDEEKSCSGLDRETLKKVRDLLIGTPMSESVVLKKREPLQTSNTFQASCTYFMEDKHAVPWQFTALITQTDDGPKAAVLMLMLTAHLKFREDGSKEPDQSKELRHAKLVRAVAELEKLGVKNLFLSPGRCIPLGEYIIRHEKTLAQPPSNEKSPEGGVNTK